MEPLFILSPCGTSLLTNGASNEQRRLINTYSNTKSIDAIPNVDADLLRECIDSVRLHLLAASVEETARLSAELHAVIKLYGGQLTGKQDHHLLLCTDTWLGEQTVRLVQNWLRDKGLAVDIRRQLDLQTADLTGFQSALSDLVKWLAEELPVWKTSHRIVFNLTGGFKSVQGFLQTLAMFYADEAVYVFESGSQLLRIPRLPLVLNTADTVRRHLIALRRLANGLEADDIRGIPETLLVTVDDQSTLSPWGNLVWQQTHRDLDREQLWPPSSANLFYGPRFMKSVEGLSSDRLLLINIRIDQLAVLLEGGPNPISLNFKPLKGRVEKYTHECNAWADQNAKRLYGYFEEDRFVLGALGKHL